MKKKRIYRICLKYNTHLKSKLLILLKRVIRLKFFLIDTIKLAQKFIEKIFIVYFLDSKLCCF